MNKGVNYQEMNENVVSLDDARKMLRQSADDGTSSENWLKELASGTIFLSRNKQRKDQKFCDQFCVIEHKEHASNLVQKTPTGQQLDLWYPTLEFSRENTLIEITSVVKLGYSDEQMAADLAQEEKEEEKETNDGSGSGSV